MCTGVERLLLAWTLAAIALAVITALSEAKVADVVGRLLAHRNGGRSDA
jgi:hypothetical protein